MDLKYQMYSTNIKMWVFSGQVFSRYKREKTDTTFGQFPIVDTGLSTDGWTWVIG